MNAAATDRTVLPSSAKVRADLYDGAEPAKQVAHGAVLARYVGYLLYFMGTALISGAVIHHPMDPSRYTKIAIAGVVLFMVATAYNDFVLTRTRPTLRTLATTMFMALLLSFGVGMVTGGLQHFEDFPQRAAGMIPIGLLMSFAAFAVKDAPAAWHRLLFGWSGLTIAVAAAATFYGLGQLALFMGPSDGHGHSHRPAAASQSAAEGADTHHLPAVQHPDSARRPAGVAPEAAAGDGHSDHDH